MAPFTAQVIAVIANIPSGTVMTYGQVAAQAGSPRGARQVVRILHSMSEKHGLPWHRVINGKGEIAIGDGDGRYMQRVLLEGEGVYVSPAGTIDLGEFRYEPEPN